MSIRHVDGIVIHEGTILIVTDDARIAQRILSYLVTRHEDVSFRYNKDKWELFIPDSIDLWLLRNRLPGIKFDIGPIDWDIS
jgi:hypothetical protein